MKLVLAAVAAGAATLLAGATIARAECAAEIARSFVDAREERVDLLKQADVEAPEQQALAELWVAFVGSCDLALGEHSRFTGIDAAVAARPPAAQQDRARIAETIRSAP